MATIKRPPDLLDDRSDARSVFLAGSIEMGAAEVRFGIPTVSTLEELIGAIRERVRSG